MTANPLLADEENPTIVDTLLQPDPSDAVNSTFKRYFGNNIVFCWYKGEPLFNIGPQAQIFLGCLITFILIGLGVYFFIADTQSMKIRFVFLGMIVLEAVVYIYSGLKNPGIVSAKTESDIPVGDDRKLRKFCPKCQIIRGQRTYHCLDCDVCIKGYDHHCPWTGKCVGEGNLYGFYLFLFTTFVYFASCIALLIMRIFLITL